MSGEMVERIEGLAARQNAIIAALRMGNTRTAAAQASGVCRDTFYAWLRHNPTFSDACKAAEANAEIDFAGIVRQGARGGELKKRTITRKADGTVTAVEEWTVGDWRAAAWWLDHRKRDWQPPKEIDVSKLTDDQLARLLSEEAESGSGEEESEAESEGAAEDPEADTGDGVPS